MEVEERAETEMMTEERAEAMKRRKEAEARAIKRRRIVPISSKADVCMEESARRESTIPRKKVKIRDQGRIFPRRWSAPPGVPGEER